MSNSIPSHPLLSDLPTPPQDAKLRLTTMMHLTKIHPLVAKDRYAEAVIEANKNKIEKLLKDNEVWRMRREGYSKSILGIKPYLKMGLYRDLNLEEEEEVE